MPPSDVCWHWARGECKKGKSCKFKHYLEPKTEEKEKEKENGDEWTEKVAEAMLSKMRAGAPISTTEGASAAAPGSSTGGESAEVPGAAKAFATEVRKMTPAVQAYYDELLKFARDD